MLFPTKRWAFMKLVSWPDHMTIVEINVFTSLARVPCLGQARTHVLHRS